MSKRPAIINLIEERRGPTAEGPWSEWTWEQPSGLTIGRANTTVDAEAWSRHLGPRCMSIDWTGAQVWR